MNDRLEEQYRRQARHQASEYARYGTPLLDAMHSPLASYGVMAVDPAAINQMHASLCAHLHGEVDELVRCGDWKLHARGEMAPKSSIIQEIVDVQKFLYNLMLLHGIKPEEIDVGFHQKSDVVERRVGLEILKAKAKGGELGPVLVLDLDGVLCDRDTELLKFAYFQDAGDGDPGYESTQQFRQAHGQRAYEQLKRDFYLDGGFSRCGIFDDARRAIDDGRIRVHGPVIFCTSRDVKRYPQLEWETHAWLDAHGIRYDAIVFSAEKERALAWLDRDSVAVDDEVEHVDKLAYVCRSVLYESVRDLDSAILSWRYARETWRIRRGEPTVAAEAKAGAADLVDLQLGPATTGRPRGGHAADYQ